MKYQILQLKKDAQNYQLLAFRTIQLLHDAGLKPSKNNYQEIYEGEIAQFDTRTLDTLFAQFQGQKPASYKGHSLSISDIIHIDDKYYYVDDIGFVQLNDFDNGTADFHLTIQFSFQQKVITKVISLHELDLQHYDYLWDYWFEMEVNGIKYTFELTAQKDKCGKPTTSNAYINIYKEDEEQIILNFDEVQFV